MYHEYFFSLSLSPFFPLERYPKTSKKIIIRSSSHEEKL